MIVCIEECNWTITCHRLRSFVKRELNAVKKEIVGLSM